MDWNAINIVNGMCFKTITTTLYITVGGFGNISSLIIFNNQFFKAKPTTFYLNGICLMNIVTILYMPIMFLAPIWIISTFTCKMFPGLFIIICELQAWITTFGSIDRLISTLKPNRFIVKDKFKFQMSLIVITICVICILVFPAYSVGTSYSTIFNATVCSAENQPIWEFIYFKIQYTLFRAIIPFLIMIISSCIVAIKMYKMKNALNIRNGDRQKEINLFISLAALDIFFILFRIPMLIYLLLNNGFNIFLDINYSIYVAIGLLSNVLMVIILAISNKVYRQFLLKYLKLQSCTQVVSPQ